MKQKHDVYPFVPKSTRWLRPGHFWALPLSDGTFGCGRVIEVPEGEIRPQFFLAGLLDWHGSSLPTSASIAGAPCIQQGQAHLRAITRTGGEVLGFRDLKLDAISPWLFRGAEGWPNSHVYRGLTPIRRQKSTDDRLPVMGVFGYEFLRVVAEARFVERT